MGWFSSQNAPETPDPALRQDRQKCWDNRDAYFACLDAAGIVKPGDEDNACAASKVAYEGNCAKSWIDYFNKRRVLAEQQQGVLAQVKNQATAAKRT
ncbi:hypothetical protein PHLCEN_2v1915 [Hermanssonia centrifuga]|uniref:Uncharacterized protein n=1 Tax=Hermanssonia centrifuga TaxID=98765 RepID=A0A2R6RVH5_9APHY|nr:hypothetical protein PHLCEN_2v1915 [Hermanssonia centrifuga]